jgi:hypothetical protein
VCRAYYRPSTSYGIASGPSNSWKDDGQATDRRCVVRHAGVRRAGVWRLSRLTHYVTVTCDLACETFDRASDLIDLATNNGMMIVKKSFFH